MTDQRDSTLDNQQRASDPQASSWVSANAGCGKTHVLVNRLIRLLLAGVPLAGIVCLTYTRAAASEMKARLYQRLGDWQHEKDEQILTELREISGLQAEKMSVSVARGLLRHVLQQREGVRIQTIHSFCHHLLARFPIEAGLETSGFDILEDFEAARLEKKAFDSCIDNIASGEHVDLQDHLAEIALGQSESDVRTLLVRARRALPDTPPLHQQQTFARLEDEFLAQDEQLRDKRLKQDKDQQTKTTDKDEMARWFQAPRATRRAAIDGGLPLWDDYRSLFLTATGTARKTKDDVLLAHQELVLDWIEKRKAYYRDSPSLALVARHFDGLYQRLKADNGKLDYDDLIDKTLALLEQDGGVNWVTYKLDQGIEHILVDEAQDTAPRQWQLIHALSQDFFAGEGTHEKPRTIFAVGDFKQSIYGFQGAEPQGFRRAQAYYAQRVPSLDWRPLDLQHNFRSSAAILQFVDKAMTVSGVNLGIEVIPPHRAWHEDNRGLVELWRCYDKPQAVKPNYQESWVRKDIEADGAPDTTAQLIAKRVRALLDSGDRLDMTGKPIQAGDIMLLFRARNELYRQVIQELHRHKVPIAGMDRLQLQNDLAVMDLCALAQWVLLPLDDFTLACLLKSPLCGIDEDALQKLAMTRENKSLWQVLQASKEHTDACAFLKDMLKLADTAPPFEFFQRVLAHHGKRQAFYEAQGIECGDIIDELLNAVLIYERATPPSLQGFLDWFNQGAIEIKRDMESQHDKVRLLTIHGAKGLEAPIVILASGHWQDRSKKASEPTRRNGKLVWYGVQENMDEDSKKDDEQQKQEGYKEDNRLLYVALTRAKERLYIAGYDRTETDKKKDSEWLEQKDNGDNAPPRRYCVLFSAFEALQQEFAAGERPADFSLDKGNDDETWQWRLLYEPKHKKKTPVEEAKKDEHVTLPSWAVAPPRKASVPEATAETQAKQDKARHVLSPLQEDQAVQRGNAVHHVLERLPLDAANKTPDEREKMIRQLLGDYAGDKDEIVQKIQALFTDDEIKKLLARPCQREVSLMDGEGETLAVHRIDRLIIGDDKILIIDYKSDAVPPKDSQGIPSSYRDQLRRYRDKMQALYPDVPCESYLLWTSTARLMPVK